MVKGLAAAGAAILLVGACAEGPTAPQSAAFDSPLFAAAQGGPQSATDSYVVPGTASDVTPLETGFDLKAGLPIVVTAAGSVSWFGPGLGAATPDGSPVDPGGMLDPSLPTISLLATVGDGPYQFVGSGPTELSGSGALRFYVNDSFFGDNGGSWTVEVTYDCQPGQGLGDQNHYHCGAPGQNK